MKKRKKRKYFGYKSFGKVYSSKARIKKELKGIRVSIKCG